MDLRQIKDNLNFSLTRMIAEGGMGKVYEAFQQGAQGFTKKMALKIINTEMGSDPEFVEMFIGEAKLVANLVHQNIVQIYQLGQTSDNFYIAMEHIDGINLKEFLDRHYDAGKMVPVDLACFIVSRVCRGLEYAHDKRDENGELLGVVHRDVSPKNIMLNSEGVVKLTDFGIAKAANYMRNREGDILLGKIQYMSPEQASFGNTDRRSDLFSLGVVFFEVLSGRGLFGEDEDTIIILDRVVNEFIPSVRQRRTDVPEEVDKILRKSLERDLTRRYQTAKEMGDDLEHFMYDKGFGPTNQTLERYLRDLLAEKPL